MMTREEFDNIKKGDKIWKYRDGSPLDGYLVCRVERICNRVPVVYIRGEPYTYEDLCDNFQVSEPEPKEDNPKGLDLPNFTAADLLGANIPKDNLLIKRSAKDYKAKTMKKKKVSKGHIYNPNPSKVDKRICLLCFHGLNRGLEYILLYSIAKWDRLDILLQLGLAEDEAGLRKAAKVAGVKYKKAKKYLAQF